MTSESQNVTISQGETRTLKITVRDADGVAYDLSGPPTLTWKLYHPLKGVVLTKDNGVAGGVTITDAAAGKMEVAISAENTKLLAPLTYTHGVRYKLSAVEDDVTVGTFKIKASRLV